MSKKKVDVFDEWMAWFSSTNVRSCSLSARGLWVEMLAIMWEAKYRGTLTINGEQIHSKTLAKLVGDDEFVIIEYLVELERAGVFIRLPDGTIINQPMYDAAKLSETRANAGRKRWLPVEQNADQSGSKDSCIVGSKNEASPLSPPLSPSPSHTLPLPLTPPLTPVFSFLEIDSILGKRKDKRGSMRGRGKLQTDSKTLAEFEQFWESYPFVLGNFKGHKQVCEVKFRILKKRVGLDVIASAFNGYVDYLKHLRVKKNFKRSPMQADTFLDNDRWKEFVGYVYTPPL